MHVSGFHFDLYSFLRFIFTALAVSIGLLHLVKRTASKYFIVDANFDEGGGGGDAIGSSTRGSQMIAVGSADDCCVVCGNSGSKKCSRCKSVRYCSPKCQSKDWKEGHRLKCKDVSSRQQNSIDRSKSSTEIQQLKKVLFPYEEFVKLFNWEKQGFPPCGLLNCGNSCFANVVLQCLSCTRPLIAYMLERGHRRECRRNDWCFLCELQSHVERARLLQPFSPINILSRLPNIGGNLGYGKQEDAHEFMRFAIDTMQSVCLDEFGGEKALHPISQETTLIQYTFGGHLQSQVTCTKCNKISYRYENMMDLTVEIQGDAASLEDCLDQFTAEEWLDGENMYKCEGCNDYVKACKRLTIHQAPNILTIALKRFQSGRYGKLNKRVTFPETLDLGPYMSRQGDGTDLYKLYAVVVHVDMLNASFFGHYICYTKDFRGNWYRVDDCKVVPVELEEVLAQGAYMLLYSRTCARASCANLLETSKEEDSHPTEVAKEAQICLDHDESIPIEGSKQSVTIESIASDMRSPAEYTACQKADSVCMDLDDPLKVNLRFTGDENLDSGLNEPAKAKERSQDAVDMDVDDPNEVKLMSASGDQLDLSSRNPESPMGSNDLDGHEIKPSHATITASVENFNGRVSQMVPPGRIIPSIETHNLECEVSGTNLEEKCGFENNIGEEDIYGKQSMASEIRMDACVSSQSDIQRKASCTLPENSITKILNEGNPRPNSTAEQVTTVESVKAFLAAPSTEFKPSKSSEDNSCSRAKLKPLFSSGFLDKQSRYRSSNRNGKAPVRSGEVGVSAKVSNNCNGFTEPVVSHQNINVGDNGCLNPDTILRSSAFERRPDKSLIGGEMNNGKLGHDFCSGSSDVAESASTAKVQYDIPSLDMECTSGSGDEACNSYNKDGMPPELNTVYFYPNQNGCEIDRTSSSAPIAASSSDIEMQDEPNHTSLQSRPHPGLEQVASVESGKGYPAADSIFYEATGNTSCSKTKLNPLLAPGFLDKRTKQKLHNGNGNFQTGPDEVGHFSKVNCSNGFDNPGFPHQDGTHTYDRGEKVDDNGISKSSGLIEDQYKMNGRTKMNGGTDKGSGEGSNAHKSHCNGKDIPVFVYEENKTSNNGSAQELVRRNQKNVFSRGFLDKPLRKKPHKKDDDDESLDTSEIVSSKHGNDSSKNGNKLPRVG